MNDSLWLFRLPRPASVPSISRENLKSPLSPLLPHRDITGPTSEAISLPLLAGRGGVWLPRPERSRLHQAGCEQSRGRGQCGLLSAGPGHGEGRKAWVPSGDIKVCPMRQYSHVQILTFSIVNGHICCMTGKRCVHRLGNQHSPQIRTSVPGRL